MKKIYLLALFLFLIIPLYSLSKAKWTKSGTSWDFNDSKIITRSPNTSPWEFYELSNLNSIISIEQFESITDIVIEANAFDRETTPTEIMFSFAVLSESKSWFYHIYAFKITGGYWGMNKVSLIYSDRLDKTKPLNTKNNVYVKELASNDFKIKYDKMYKYHIIFEGKDVALYINNEKVLSAPFPEKTHDGRIAISAKNVRIAVDKVEVKQNDKIIFEDDFNENSILIRYVKASKESPLKDETEKKP